jgi:hypothetical protein
MKIHGHDSRFPYPVPLLIQQTALRPADKSFAILQCPSNMLRPLQATLREVICKEIQV